MSIDWRRYVREHLPPLNVPAGRDHDIVDELALQLETVYERERSAGGSHESALAAAEAEVQDWQALGRTLHAIEPPPSAPITRGDLMTGIGGDIRFALRGLHRTPAFTAVSIATLALGLGMATAAFSVLDTILIKPLRFGSPNRLVLVHASVPPDGRDTNEITYLDAMDLADETSVFESLAVIMPFAGTATALDPPERVTGFDVSPSIFQTLGVQPMLGRAFTREEAQAGAPNVVIVGNGFWRRLGGRPDIIGQALILDDVPYTVVGVMPPGFRVEVLNVADAVYRPVTPRHFAAGNRGLRAFRAVAKLHASVRLDQAQAATSIVGDRLADAYPDTNRGRQFTLRPLQEDIVGNVRPALFLVAGLVLLVLLIAAVNLTNLLFARAIARAREVAVRVALGASVWRLSRGSLVEAAILAILGSIGAAVVGYMIVSALVATPGVVLPRLGELAIDWRALTALAIAAVLTSIAVGAIPFVMHRRLHDTAALRTGHETAGRFEGRVRSILVAAQTALAFMLLAATMLLTVSLRQVLAVPSGFDSGIATMRIAAPAARYPTREATARFFADVVDDLVQEPGISKAGFVSILPLTGNNGSTMTVQGREDVPMTERPEVGWQWADPGYFEAMGMRIIRGRGFSRSDVQRPQHVTVISETLARMHFAGEDPVGKRVYFGGIPPTGVPEWHEIIGVVGDVRHRVLENEPDARAYDLFGQHWGRTISLALRTDATASNAATTVRSVLARRDPRLAVFAVQSTDDIISGAVATRRLLLWLVAGFAAIGLVVALLGVYGIVACLLAERRREIGVRIAIGASAARIHRLVMSHGLTLVGAGVIAGVAGTIALRKTIESQLFNISPTNVPLLAAVATALVAVAALPCLIVSRRATRVDPVRALRSE